MHVRTDLGPCRLQRLIGVDGDCSPGCAYYLDERTASAISIVDCEAGCLLADAIRGGDVTPGAARDLLRAAGRSRRRRRLVYAA
jgi:hypothetical protein